MTTHLITGDAIQISRRHGSSNAIMPVVGSELFFKNNTAFTKIITDRIEAIAAGSTIRVFVGAVEVLNIDEDGVDFKSLPVRNLTTQLITELGPDLVIQDSLEIGNASGCKLYLSGGNLLLTSPTGKNVQLCVNGVSALTVTSTAVNFPYGELTLAAGGVTLTQSSGNALYRVNSSKYHDLQINGVSALRASAGSVAIVPDQAANFTMSADANYGYMDIASGKSLRVRQAGPSTMFEVNGTVSTFYSGLSVAPGTNSTSTTTGALRTSGGLGVVKEIFAGGNVTGATFSVNDALGYLTQSLIAGSSSNDSVGVRLRPNYLTTNLNGWNIRSTYGDDGTGDNRKNAALYFDQSLYSGGAFQPHETRMKFGSINRRVCFYTTAGSAGTDNGDIYFSAGEAYKAGTQWVTTSDQRLKKEIEPITGKRALDAISSLSLKQFKYDTDYVEKYGMVDRTYAGLLAQDVKDSTDPLVADCVRECEDEVFYSDEKKAGEDGIPVRTERRVVSKRLALDTSNISMLQIGAISELDRRVKLLVTALESANQTIATLSERIRRLESGGSTQGASSGSNLSLSASMGL